VTHAQSIRVSADRTCRFRQITGGGFRLAIELTSRCDLACAHCFVGGPEATISYADLERMTRQARLAGCRKVILTGGEPLLHPDLARLVALVTELGMLADLNSNLILLDESLARAMVEAGLQETSVSLYGSPTSHGRLTRNAQAYDKTIRSIRLLRSLDVTVDVHGALWDGNLREAEQLLAICEEMDCASLTFFSILPIEGHRMFALAHEEALATINGLRKRASIPVRSVGLHRPCFEECAMGSGVFGITADLRLKPCLLARPLQGRTPSLCAQDLQASLDKVREDVAAGRWSPACVDGTEDRPEG
jgi:MoaA/NifB/PqqE/SkfB family radical SAM enzyme